VAPAEQTCMGFGVAAAIGAKLARPDAYVVCVTGDGAFQMYMQELPTAVQYGAPVVWVVLNNASLGWCKWIQRATGERYLRFLLDELDVRDEATQAAMSRWRRGYNLPRGLWTELEPDAEAALRLARAEGLRTAVISNSNGTIADILAELGLARHVEFVIDSSTVGVEKPDPRIFRLALERAGVAAHESVYVGDLYSIDVVGARAAGLRAILLDPGACWGARDCPTAITVLDAVHQVLAGQ